MLRPAASLLLRGLCSEGGMASFSTLIPKPDWKSIKIPASTAKDIPEINAILPTATGGASFPGDIRATSGLGKGDGCKTHTAKWLQVRCFLND